MAILIKIFEVLELLWGYIYATHSQKQRWTKAEIESGVLSEEIQSSVLMAEPIFKLLKGKIAREIHIAASKYNFDALPYIPAGTQGISLFDKEALGLHFSGANQRMGMDHTFIDPNRKANSTLGVGKSEADDDNPYDKKIAGGVCRYLENIRRPAYTQGPGLTVTECGFYTFTGQKIRNPNNIMVSVEAVGWGDKFTDFQYRQIAVFHVYCNRIFPNYRLWAVAGHEHISPIERNDPGHNWDWEYFLVGLVGMRKWFFDRFMRYLPNTSGPTMGNKEYAHRKYIAVQAGYDRIIAECTGKPKDYCFKTQP